MPSNIMSARITHGRNGDNEKLVHIEVSGLVSPPYPKSFTYMDGRVGWRDRLTDPIVDLPKKVRSFVEKGKSYICILGFSGGYAELTLNDGNCSEIQWLTGNATTT